MNDEKFTRFVNFVLNDSTYVFDELYQSIDKIITLQKKDNLSKEETTDLDRL